MIAHLSSFQKTDFPRRENLSLFFSLFIQPFPRHQRSLFSTQRGLFLWTRVECRATVKFSVTMSLCTPTQENSSCIRTFVTSSLQPSFAHRATKQNGETFPGEGGNTAHPIFAGNVLRWLEHDLERDVYDLSKFPRVETRDREKSRDCFITIDHLSLLFELIERHSLKMWNRFSSKNWKHFEFFFFFLEKLKGFRWKLKKKFHRDRFKKKNRVWFRYISWYIYARKILLHEPP